MILPALKQILPTLNKTTKGATTAVKQCYSPVWFTLQEWVHSLLYAFPMMTVGLSFQDIMSQFVAFGFKIILVVRVWMNFYGYIFNNFQAITT